ncbi:tRNA (N(6)-L-threonylcarbamoyladenosine(37)-C(2))-methylthiotransferase MtaB [Blastopirellula retiformator]|uniref:Threonylcarbamoyladenosine tRNA methylthiotransferase MtaB n=1 Tax=Blastopirellula retiformator TaxID=2527970 RepID=A0A5C5UYU6_9BACT|nr:tRNA (N(6)-L-threonylcarbamoyladenosine(37)-C(2))-methylthiotransferase MtaB [Blastopirellula retiformator]TWT30800.1 Threonylcarbamoyladenosine tRNA methylthiotransferase MtaB [Blastopirellula retiformator]
MMTEKALKTVTLGCKVNQYETELVREGLVTAGYRDVAEGESADLCVVNTCTVTNEGDAKSRQVIRRLARDNPDSRIVVMGCYATRAPGELAALPNVVEVVENKREIPDLLGRFGVIDVPTGLSTFGDRHRAYVKVQDGCLLRCTFCIIPTVRPEMYSRPAADILEEVARLADNGFREIVLTGIHLGHFGVDLNKGKPKSEWMRLAHLVRDLAKLDGDFRVRMSSIEATEVTRELIDVMGEFPDRVCPHLHISMQSGSDAVLRRMRRRWGAQRFVDRCKLLKERLDQPAISTDIIVGFPGETDAEFEETCAVSREVGFSKIHIFPFSPRKGTPAAEMSDHIPGDVKADRRRRLAEVETEAREIYFRSLVGKRLAVLGEAAETDTAGQTVVRGTACRYAPVSFAADADAVGKLTQVEISQAQSELLLGAAR